MDVREAGEPATPITSIALHPEQVRRNTLFVKTRYPELRSVTAREALRVGARYVVLEEDDEELPSLPAGTPVAVVRNVKRAYATACANFAGNVHRKLTLIGVTGTKGKTTTCHLIDAALRAAGLRTGLISSAVWRLPDAEAVARNTTPEPALLHHFFHELHRQGGTHAVLEVSSIGILEERVHGLAFAGVAFTNLGTDHFEYHGGRDAYLATKRRLFDDPAFHASPNTICALNADDPVGRSFAGSAAGRVVTYGLRDADVTPESYSFDSSGLSIRLDGVDVRLPLVGEHNVSNALAAYTLTADILGSGRAAAEAMGHAQPVPGRLERVPTTLGMDVYVDFAHTPESVTAVLTALRAVAGSRRCIAVVGCSGKSDHGKRAPMARAAVSGADQVVITSDNPNHEHPGSIARDMLAGISADVASERFRVVLDRHSAIKAAIELAQPDGIVVLLGKGTETYQMINGRRTPHSDAASAASVLRELEARSAAG